MAQQPTHRRIWTPPRRKIWPPHDIGIGFGGKFSWASVPDLHTLLIGGQGEIDADASVALVNGGFDTDTDWTKETGWTIGSGVASKSAGTAGTIHQVDGTVGLRYRLDWKLVSRSAGTAAAWAGTAATGQSSPAAYSQELTATAVELGVYADAAFAGTVDDVSVTSLSRNQWQDQSGNGHHFSQATDANKPWSTTDSGLSVMRFDVDYLVSDDAASAWNFLHDGTGCTIACRYHVYSDGHWLDCLRDLATRVGLNLYAAPATNQILVKIGNGSGTYVKNVSVGGAGGVGKHTMVFRYSSTASPQILLVVDGSTILSASEDVAPSAADPSYTPYLCAFAGGLGGIQISMPLFAVCNAALSDAWINKLSNELGKGWL